MTYTIVIRVSIHFKVSRWQSQLKLYLLTPGLLPLISTVLSMASISSTPTYGSFPSTTDNHFPEVGISRTTCTIHQTCCADPNTEKMTI